MALSNGQHYESLDEALREMHIPLENHPTIRNVTTAIGTKHYIRTGSYIKAVRLSGGPALNIHYGWTNGFESRDEAERATQGLVEVWPSGRGQGQWGITHPVNRMHESGVRQNGANEGTQGTCPTCNTLRSVTGTCMCE